MIVLEMTFYAGIILFIMIIFRVKNKIDNPKEMFADILIMISAVFGTIGIFNLILIKGLKINSSFLENSVFFIIVSVVCLIATYLVYFKEKDKDNKPLIWFLSEIFMAFGLNIILLGIVYVYQEIGHLSDEILKESFPIFFVNKNDPISNEQLYNIKMAGNIFILITGILSIITGLSLNSYRQNNKKIKTEKFNIKHNISK